MFTKVSLLVLLGAAAVLSAPPPYRPAPYPAYPDTPPQYQYQYSVADEYAALQFGQDEQREGYGTSGSYRVLLPDGRLQTVTYTVDGESGFEAEVSYEGEARRYQPEPRYGPRPHRPAPVYQPRPRYHPAPAYGHPRPRTYTLQTAAEAPLAATDETEVAEPAAGEPAEEAAEDAAEEADAEVEVEEEVVEAAEEEAEAEQEAYQEAEQEAYQEAEE